MSYIYYATGRIPSRYLDPNLDYILGLKNRNVNVTYSSQYTIRSQDLVSKLTQVRQERNLVCTFVHPILHLWSETEGQQ